MDSEVESLFISLKLNADSLKKGLEDVDKRLKQLSQKTDKTSREFANMGRQFTGALRKMRNEFIGFMSVFTAGKSIKNFIEDTIQSSAELDRLSQRLGIAASRLRAYKDANEIAGGSGEGILGQLKRNADALSEFRLSLGVSDSLKWSMNQGITMDQFRDAETWLKAQSDVIARLYKRDPNQARIIARQIGIDEDTFMLLKDGSSALEAYLRNAEKLSGMTDKDAKATEKLRKEFVELKMAFVQTGERIVYALNPAFKTIIEIGRDLAQWVNENQDSIVGFFKDAAEWVKTFVKNFREGKFDSQIDDLKKVAAAFRDIALALADVVRWWNGIGNKDKDVHHFLGMRFGKTEVLDREDRNNGDVNARKRYIANELKKNGFTDEQAAGIIGNLLQENSTLDPKIVNEIGATGIAQWTKSRKEDFKRLFGKEIGGGSFEEQVKFLIWELNNSEKRAGGLVRQTRSVPEATLVFGKNYERAGDKEARYDKRIAYAEQAYHDLFRKPVFTSGGGSMSESILSRLTPYGYITGRTGNNNITVSGPVTINTRSTDPKGIKREMTGGIVRYSTAPQFNTGMF